MQTTWAGAVGMVELLAMQNYMPYSIASLTRLINFYLQSYMNKFITICNYVNLKKVGNRKYYWCFYCCSEVLQCHFGFGGFWIMQKYACVMVNL